MSKSLIEAKTTKAITEERVLISYTFTQPISDLSVLGNAITELVRTTAVEITPSLMELVVNLLDDFRLLITCRGTGRLNCRDKLLIQEDTELGPR